MSGKCSILSSTNARKMPDLRWALTRGNGLFDKVRTYGKFLLG